MWRRKRNNFDAEEIFGHPSPPPETTPMGSLKGFRWEKGNKMLEEFAKAEKYKWSLTTILKEGNINLLKQIVLSQVKQRSNNIVD